MILTETKLTGSLESDLTKFTKDIQDKVIFAGVAAMARVIYDDMKTTTAFNDKTGTLRKSIYRVFSKDRSGQFVKTYHIGPNKSKAPHWALIEYGTVRSPAYPYIRPAFDKIGQAIEAGKTRMAQKMTEL